MADSKDKTPLEYWLALSSVEGLGSVRIKRLIARFGSVKAIFEAELPEIARLPSFNPVLASRILTVSGNLPTFRDRLTALNNQNIRVLCPEDAAYPAQLKPLPDAPAILCHTGELTKIDAQCVAIVGTKQPTTEAIQLTLSLATALALAGFTIVSGLAAGIDANAHAGALAAMGKTIGVVGTDLSSIYPVQNNSLAMQIYENGCLFSEHPFRTSPSPGNLIQRNRIISGLALATIVIEAQKTGGAMHTARYAQRQDKALLACRWDGPAAATREGPRALIRGGAFPFAPNEVDKVVDVLLNPAQLETYMTGTSSEQMGLFEE
ncbi:DNA-protecting protein DprA [Candidatus Poribacteria bacterium]|nr:MAG: DNA-protecting protein DprA [Candidatus Poribacteria bacterium]